MAAKKRVKKPKETQFGVPVQPTQALGGGEVMAAAKKPKEKQFAIVLRDGKVDSVHATKVWARSFRADWGPSTARIFECLIQEEIREAKPKAGKLEAKPGIKRG